MSHLRPTLAAAALPVLLFAVVVSAALAVRLLLVETPQFACQVVDPPAWCVLRAIAIGAVRGGLPGFVALAAGVLALWRGSNAAALTAVAAGAAGLGLYLPEPAAAGVLLGALALVRRPA